MDGSINVNLPHHVKEDLCTSRPAYRQGRKLTSVKVEDSIFNRESQHLLIYNVPAINLDIEVHKLCERFGEVTCCVRIPSQEVEEFTCVYHIRYTKVYQARLAKRKMDDMSFYGGILHVSYAPELETVEETKDKLCIRRKEVAFHLRKLEFPQLFRPERRGKVKRKNQASQDKALMSTNYGSNFVHEMIPSQQHDEPSFSRMVQPEPKQPPVDVTPFRKLVPSKVSRIVFHKKIDNVK